MFIANDRYLKTVKELLGSDEKIDMAIAFLGAGAEELFSEAESRIIRIICNLESGATNPEPIEELLTRKPRISIKTNRNLHAKAFITESSALVGSANLSANGLGLEGKELAHWQEAGILSRNRKDIKAAQKWYDSLWNESQPITEKMLKDAQEAWAKRRSNRPVNPMDGRKSLYDRILEDPEFCKDRPFYLTIWSDESISPEGKNEFSKINQKQIKQGEQEFECYEDFYDFPNNSYLLDFKIDSNRSLIPWGLYSTGPKVFFHKSGENEQHHIQLVLKLEEFNGMNASSKVGEKFGNEIAKNLNKLTKKPKDGLLLHLYKALEQMGMAKQ